MPDIQHRTFHRVSRPEIRDGAMHPSPVACILEAGDDGVAHGFLRRILAPEGAEDGSCGGFVFGGGGELVGDFVDEGFKAEDVAEELAFVSAVVGHAAGFVELCAVSQAFGCIGGLDACTSSRPLIHSSTVSSFSRAKSWRCWIRLVVSFRTLGVAFGPVALITACVKWGLNLCCLLSETAPFEVILDRVPQSAV
jgi:hypothetical protein